MKHIRTSNALFSALALSFLLLLSSCKKDKDKPQPQNEPATGTVTINGKDYPTRKIGDRTWTLTNYDGPGGLPFGTGTEHPEYGRYYTKDEVEALQLPQGWRIPTAEDYRQLCLSQGVVFVSNLRATAQPAIKKLVSQTQWRKVNGSNETGFNAYPANYMFQNGQPIPGDIAEFWTSEGVTISFMEGADGATHNIHFYDSNQPGYRFNLRLVKD